MNANVTCLEAPNGSDQVLENTEELIWSLLDDDLPEEGILELESLVRKHISVRESYLNCVKLHIDLTNHFGKPVRNVHTTSD